MAWMPKHGLSSSRSAMNSAPLSALIDALADLLVSDYLAEKASNDTARSAERSEHPIASVDQAA